jgi:inosose dehydratase
MAEAHERIATAPTSWGLCEVPGWGVQLPPERVLPEMKELGFDATEAGPDGYLGETAGEIRGLLDRYELRLVGGFLPLVLHDRGALAGSLARAERVAEHFQAAGASHLVSAVVVDESWSSRQPISRDDWRRIFDGLARVDEIAAAHELTHVLHPHWGTLVERRDDVERVLDASAARFCLDTGHLALGGTDPARFADEAAERIAHVHLKDFSETVGAELRAGALELVPAVKAGLFRPLGDGDAPVAGTVAALERSGYTGWYVLEQDTSVASADDATGPAEDVRRSYEYLLSLLEPERAPA